MADFPAFEAAMESGDKKAMLRLYSMEHTWRVRAEAEKAALLWQIAHGTSGKAAEPETSNYVTETPEPLKIKPAKSAKSAKPSPLSSSSEGI